MELFSIVNEHDNVSIKKFEPVIESGVKIDSGEFVLLVIGQFLLCRSSSHRVLDLQRQLPFRCRNHPQLNENNFSVPAK